MCGCYSLRCEFEFATCLGRVAVQFTFHFCKSQCTNHIQNRNEGYRILWSASKVLAYTNHIQTLHISYYDLTPCLTLPKRWTINVLATIPLRLHLSWTLDHVLIPVGRLKNPLLCKAGGWGLEVIWLPFGYNMLGRGSGAWKRLVKPRKTTRKIAESQKRICMKGHEGHEGTKIERREKDAGNTQFLHLKCPGLWIWPHGSYHQWHLQLSTLTKCSMTSESKGWKKTSRNL